MAFTLRIFCTMILKIIVSKLLLPLSVANELIFSSYCPFHSIRFQYWVWEKAYLQISSKYCVYVALRSLYWDFGSKGNYLEHGEVITSHSILWDVIIYLWPKYLLLTPKIHLCKWLWLNYVQVGYVPVVRTPEKTQHCPYLTGFFVVINWSRMATLPFQVVGDFPPA